MTRWFRRLFPRRFDASDFTWTSVGGPGSEIVGIDFGEGLILLDDFVTKHSDSDGVIAADSVRVEWGPDGRLYVKDAR